MESLKAIELRNWSKRAYQQEAPWKIASIMAYESGDVVRDMNRIETYPHIKALYESQAKVSLGDVLAMAQLLCSFMGWDFDEVYNSGCQRAIDRCAEKIEGKDGF